MVVESFLTVFSHLQVFFIESFGKSDPPAWMGTAGVFAGQLLSSAKGLGAWVPWTLILTVAGFNLVLWGTFLAIRIARWLLGLVPTMGGG